MHSSSKMTEECTETKLTIPQTQPHPRIFRKYNRWCRVSLYVFLSVAGQSAATLLGRLYYDRGGKSKWMATLFQNIGFPLLLPLFFYFTTHNNIGISETKPKPYTLVLLYITFGLIVAANDLMYSYGLLYLSLSTYSLIGASQLVFNAVFSYFLNAQKFTAFILNSIVLLVISVSLLAINGELSSTNKNNANPMGDVRSSDEKQRLFGFISTLAASATFALHQCLVQLAFEKVIKRETFSAVLDMQFYPCLVASICCFVGLFASGEWRNLDTEIKEYEDGTVSYVMVLFWTAVTWQISCLGVFGLIFEVSSLFSIVIDTMELPIVPLLSAIFFRDKINAVKAIAFVLALWGFLSYVYQQYLDDKKAKVDTTTNTSDDHDDFVRVEEMKERTINSL